MEVRAASIIRGRSPVEILERGKMAIPAIG